MATQMRPTAVGQRPLADEEMQAAAFRTTGIFIGVGVALLALGWLIQPRFRPARVEPESERVLFPELADASKAGSLSIVSYDDELATLKPFKVVQADGVWVLPSHDNYPADAKDQLAAAATELVDRPILDVVSTSPGDHEKYGVIEPDPEKIKPGMTGVGRLVEIRDAAGNRLARLVIGLEDKRPGQGDRGAGGRPLRFVRKAGQDPVYRIELDTAKFTTKFEDWIEKDLLKLSPWDVRRLTIDDSTASFGVDETSGRPQISQDLRSLIEVAYEDRDAKWSLVRLQDYDERGQPRDESLGDDEELSTAKLNDLRTALGDLKIVGVRRKPAGLSGDLKAEESFAGDREAVMSLAQRGFFAVQKGDIRSSNGETVVGMKDGVEYLLRFGNGTSVSSSDADEAGGEAGEKPLADTTGRYLFVTARFNDSLLEKPKVDPLPEVPGVPGNDTEPEDKKPEDKKPEDKKPEDKKPEDKKPEDKKPEESGAKEPASDQADGEENDEADQEDGVATEPKPDEPKPDESKPDESKPDESKPDESKPDEPKPDEPKPDEPKPDEPKPDEPKPDEPKPDEPKPATDKPADAAAQADEAEAKAQAALEERRRVERENRRRQEEYDGKVEAAKKRVRELNNRFSDWYYVVSDAEFAKIRLDRATVFQKKSVEPATPQ